MESLITYILKEVMNEMGVVVALLLVAIYYLHARVKQERTERLENHKRLSELAESQSEANMATYRALIQLENSIKLIASTRLKE